MPIRVLIVDDHAVVRQGLRMFLGLDPAFEIVGEAANGARALELARQLQPDVVLMDLLMPVMDGITATEAIRRELPDIEVVALTSVLEDEKVVGAIRAGAIGYLLKDAEPAELLRAVRVVAAGEALLSPSVTRRVVSLFGRHLAGGTPSAPGLDALTDREREMLAWVATGRSNQEIAKELFLSPATVRTHISRAMGKLGARDRAQLVVFAVRAGLTIPEE